MLGLTGLGQSAIAAFGPSGTPPPPPVELPGGGLSYQTTFELGSLVHIEALFGDVLNDVLADPTQVILFVMDPTGGITNVSGAIGRDGVGRYHYSFVPARSGLWTYKWRGVGAVAASSPDTSFTVNPSVIISG